MHGFRHTEIYDALRLINDDDDLPKYPTNNDDNDDKSDTDIGEKFVQTDRCIENDDPNI